MSVDHQLAHQLQTSLEAMDKSFHVRLISTFDPELVCAPADEDATDWLAQNYPQFDQFPVRSDGATVGVLYRLGEHGGKVVREAMVPLSERNVVSADMPITALIPELRESHSKLVLRGNRIDGLVTQSDLLKLPVRQLLFGLVSHLELCLRDLVRQHAPWPRWLDFLPRESRTRILSDIERLQDARFEPERLEVTHFWDVARILMNFPELGDTFGDDMDRIRHLRNEVAHSKTYISSSDDVRTFVEVYERLSFWIGKATEMVTVVE